MAASSGRVMQSECVDTGLMRWSRRDLTLAVAGAGQAASVSDRRTATALVHEEIRTFPAGRVAERESRDPGDASQQTM